MNLPDMITSAPNLCFGPTDPSLPSPISDPVDGEVFSPKPHKILYPLPLAHSRGSTETWAGLAPLEMVQKIVSLTESSMTTTVAHSDTDSQYQLGRSWLHKFLQEEAPIHTSDSHVGQKRKRDCLEEDADSGDIFEPDDSLAEALIESASDLALPQDMLKAWKPSSTVGDSPEAVTLDTLASHFESMAGGKTWCLPSYSRVEQAFLSKVVQDDSPALAVTNATHQMKVLVEMVSEEHETSPPVPTLDLELPFVSEHFDDEKELFKAYMEQFLKQNWTHPFPDAAMLHRLAQFLIQERCITLSSKESNELQGVHPAEYNKAMMDITETKVETWLVNNRTRRWRKVSQPFICQVLSSGCSF